MTDQTRCGHMLVQQLIELSPEEVRTYLLYSLIRFCEFLIQSAPSLDMYLCTSSYTIMYIYIYIYLMISKSILTLKSVSSY